jgi:hypothetical protein
MNNRPSPLFVWKVILIFVVAAGIFMYISDPMKTVLNRRDDQLLKRVAGLHFNEDEIGVVFFGDSMLDSALPPKQVALSRALTEEFRKNGGLKSVSAYEFTWGMSAMKFREIADELIKARPSVIVIQGDMIVRRILKERPPPKITDRVGTWSGVLSLQVFGKSQPEKPKETGKQRKDDGRPKKNQSSLEEAQSLWSKQDVNTADAVFVRAQEFIQRISANGIRVVMVELPVSNTAAIFSTEQYLAKRSAALHSLSKEGVLHFTYPQLLPDDHFGDYSHVNYRGRREFLKWFFPLLSKELVKR